jgi:hypothetical protein
MAFVKVTATTIVAFLLAAAPCWAADIQEGNYTVSGTVGGSAYTGSVELTRRGSNKFHVQGVYHLQNNTTEGISTDAKFDGTRLTFTEKVGNKGLVAALALEGGNKDSAKIDAVYTLGEKGVLSGVWTDSKDASFHRQDTWTPVALRIDGVTPSMVEAGSKAVALKVTGVGLPIPSDEVKKEIAFLFSGSSDGRIKLKGFGERADDGSELTLVVDVDGKATLGARSLQIRSVKKDDAVEVTVKARALPLGGSLDVHAGEKCRLTVPLGGGHLEVSTSAGNLTIDDESSHPIVTGEPKISQDVAQATVYLVEASVDAKVSNTYKISAQVKPEYQPYNFWYYPFYQEMTDDSDEPENLYAPKGALPKLDKVFAIEAKHTKFDPSKHMDNGWSTKPEHKFKMPTDAAEVAKYDPSTIAGFDYCYDRSMDSDKGWWGHCWGAVIASSLYQKPHGMTVDGISFSDEQTKGILTAYFTDHEVDANYYVQGAPAGPRVKENADSYAHSAWKGLIEGIKQQGLPLASDLRAQSTDESSKSEVWNHVIWKFDANLTQAKGDDPNYVEISIDLTATDDRFPSTDDVHRDENWVIRLRTQGGHVVEGAKDEKWVSTSHFVPSYIARITGSLSGDEGCKNAVLGGVGIKKLVEKFGFEAIK